MKEYHMKASRVTLVLSANLWKIKVSKTTYILQHCVVMFHGSIKISSYNWMIF